MCILYTTRDHHNAKIRLLYGKSQRELIDNKVTELCRVAPVRSFSGLIFFVEKEKATEVNHVVELRLQFDVDYGQWTYDKQRVYSSESDVQVL